VAAAVLLALGCGGSLPPPDPPNLAEAKDSLSRGNYWFGRGCYREAGRFFKEGEVAARLSDDVRLIIRALNSQGAAALAARDLDRAANLLAQALDLAQVQPGQPEVDRILGNLGALAQGMGRTPDAKDFWRAAAEAAVRAGASPATYLTSRARLHLAAGRHDEFLALAEEALTEARKAARPPKPENLVLADALNLAGQAARLREDEAAAEKLFRQALDLDRQMEYTVGLAQDTEALGSLLSWGERSGEATGFLDRAFHLRLALGDDQGAARVMGQLKELGTPLEAYRAALKNPAPWRLDQRCP
jgi:tetratricopeptide (TPR) repeat protein